MFRNTIIATVAAALLWAGVCRAAELQDYCKPDELKPPPDAAMSLYHAPWRANPRTVSAEAALAGVGVYYKHTPHWTEAQHTAVMTQMAAAGVRRLRLAPHHTLYIHKDWTAPEQNELERIRWEFRASHAAGIRPCVVFVHIAPAGKPDSDELAKWYTRNWNKGLAGLVPVGEIGSPSWQAYLDKVCLSLTFGLREAREAGFTERGSYDIEMGQNMWWGAPAITDPWPSTELKDLLPGSRIYEFDKAVIERARRDGYGEPVFWWGESHHILSECRNEEVPPVATGRAISFYSQGIGPRTSEWAKKAADTWPVLPERKFLEGDPPETVLARPEGWFADFSRHDNLIELLRRTDKPIAVTSLGTVPADIADRDKSPLTGWQMKQRGLTRSLAFWLNQGAAFVLIHSAYEPGQKDGGEVSHALIPGEIKDTAAFRWEDAPPLRTLRLFCDGLAGARPVEKPQDLRFRFSVEPDPVLIPRTGNAGPMRASDLVALLPFQLDDKRFAVAAYVVTPNIAVPMEPVRITVEVDRGIRGDAALLRPYTEAAGEADVLRRDAKSTTLRFPLADDVTWVRFEVE